MKAGSSNLIPTPGQTDEQTECTPAKKVKKRNTPIVEIEVRRSPRLK